ncbi:hypothetical protein L596_018468 [Steinernema carpocapsae]|uniref:Uncharacterized protein n=1 Tax=Steinernema carpocapsae TaxID=34508 RepID=A0A4U5N4S0_STECR|nr:hypothetical protein L596_018468 [Steinernema carpocapsae]
MPAGRRYGHGHGHLYRDYGAAPPIPQPNKPIVHTFETEFMCSSRCVRPCKRHNFETLMTRWVCPTTTSAASPAGTNQNPQADYNWLDDGMGAYDSLDSLEGISSSFGGAADRGQQFRISQYFIVLFVGLVLLLLVLIIIVARKCRKRVLV